MGVLVTWGGLHDSYSYEVSTNFHWNRWLRSYQIFILSRVTIATPVQLAKHLSNILIKNSFIDIRVSTKDLARRDCPWYKGIKDLEWLIGHVNSFKKSCMCSVLMLTWSYLKCRRLVLITRSLAGVSGEPSRLELSLTTNDPKLTELLFRSPNIAQLAVPQKALINLQRSTTHVCESIFYNVIFMWTFSLAHSADVVVHYRVFYGVTLLDLHKNIIGEEH